MKSIRILAALLAFLTLPVAAVLVTSDTSVTVPTLPGYSYHCSAVGNWGGATVILQTNVDGGWRALPGNAMTDDFEVVHVASAREMRALVSGSSGSTSLSLAWAEIREGDISAAGATIPDGGLAMTKIAGLTAPMDILPNKILIRDLFAGPAEVALAFTNTRLAEPGPGQLEAMGVPGVSQMVVGKNSLSMTRNPVNAGGKCSVRWNTSATVPGVIAAPGLTMITRLVPGYNGQYSNELAGFSLSATDLEANSAGAFYFYNGGNNGNEPISIFANPRDATKTVGDFSAAADVGQLISLAVKYVSPTERTYWIQGGTMAESFGCYNYSNDWMQIGYEKDATAIANGTTVYPFVSKVGGGHGLLNVREVQVLSDWEPTKRHSMLDVINANGVHCPAIEADPVTGLLVTAWNNGSSHENIDTKINARVRLASGVWTDLQTLVPALGTPAIMNIGSLSKVNGALWLTYWRNPSGPGGGTLYRRTVTVNSTTGVITMGGETTLGIAGTINLAFTPLLTIPTGVYAGRILASVHDGSVFDTKISRSTDNGITWTTAAAIPKHAAANGWHVEPALVMESDGAIGCYMRTAGFVVCYSRSTDGGSTWGTSVPINNLPSFGRTMVRNLPDGSILAMSADSNVQRRAIKAWRMGDNGAVLGSQPLGDAAVSGSVGTTIFQYPTFIQEGNDLTYMVSHQGPIGRSSMEIHTRRWRGGLELAFDLTGKAEANRKSTLNHYPDQSLFLGPKGANCVALTSAPTVATPCRLSDNFVLTLATNVTLSAPTLPLPYQECTWYFKQDGVGMRTLVLDAIFKPGPNVITLSTIAGTTDILTAIYDPAAGNWKVTNLLKGY